MLEDLSPSLLLEAGQPLVVAEVSCGFTWMRLGKAQGWKFPHLLMKMLFLMPSLWFVLLPLVPSPSIEKSLLCCLHIPG